MVIAVGYRVNSKIGTEFRKWANKILKEYLISGYAINEQKLSEYKEKYNDLIKVVEMIGSVESQKELTRIFLVHQFKKQQSLTVRMIFNLRECMQSF